MIKTVHPTIMTETNHHALMITVHPTIMTETNLPPITTDLGGYDKVQFTMFVGCTSSNEIQNLNNLVNESKDCAIVDSGCVTTVCGNPWADTFIDSLSPELRSQIEVQPSNQTFTFGDGKTYTSKRKIKLPCWLGGLRGEFYTDVIDCNIPLLLSRKSMKAIDAVLHFKKEEMTIQGGGTHQTINYKIRSSGFTYQFMTKFGKANILEHHHWL